LRSSSWFAVFIVSALIGAVAGYFVTLIYKPGLIPPVLRIGGLTMPTTILFLGTDVVYTRERRALKADKSAFTGRSDTVMVARLDPIRNSVTMLSIPRDTTVHIPGHGRQKINGANAIGGPQLAMETVREFLGIPIDHYVVLNVHALVELVDELGGLTIEIPKKMKYRDRSAKLNIDLEPGAHLLNGTEAMGFVRFRHDELGDIGRVQRQELFLKAVQEKGMDPMSWGKVPKLLEIAQRHLLTDLSTAQLMQYATFARAVPKENQTMIMMPGHFTGTGDWGVDDNDLQEVVARLMGQPKSPNTRDAISITVENAASDPNAGRQLYNWLANKGYHVVTFRKSSLHDAPLRATRIIAQKGNVEEAKLVRFDLGHGDIVNASVGDIYTSITIIAGDDISDITKTTSTVRQVSRRRRSH
jgi:polyisoprenyl-teichoic acid--peptidoglycan teichoic acid transferase